MIAVGSDHAAFPLKTELVQYLKEQGIPFYDYGTYSADSVDYPQIAKTVAGAVVKGEAEKGLLLCGTGIGISIAANKVRGIRAALCSDTHSARMARAHNDANVLCMGGRVLGLDAAKAILRVFLNTPFEGGRHQLRVDMIADMERDDGEHGA